MIRWESIHSFLHGLIAPPGQICVACGNRGALSITLPGLCPLCVSSIPWIRSIRCHRCGRAIGCPDCARAENLRRSFEMNRSAVGYDDLMREWLAVYKYRGKERMAPLLGSMLGTAYRALQRELTPSPQMIWQAAAITFVPVSEERYIERGFNQAERLAEVLSNEVRLPVIPMLMRTQHTEKQSYKSRKERVESMRNIFAVPEDASVYMKKVQMNLSLSDQPHPVHLILVDDVYTTGSTLEACSQAIKQWGEVNSIDFKIYTLTWARS